MPNLEIEAEIEEGIFAIKENLKIGRDTLLEVGLLNGHQLLLKFQKKENSFEVFSFKKIDDLSELSIEILSEYTEHNSGKRKQIVIVNEIEYTTKEWDRKVFKFANAFNVKAKNTKIEVYKPTLFDNNIITKSNRIKTNKS